MSLFLMLNTKEDILKNQTVVGPHWLFLSPQKTIEISYHYHLITSILQITFFCVQHKNETHTGLEQHEGE